MTSVVIPVYNAAAVLDVTGPAALALCDVAEIVWVDDGSSDGTAERLDSLAQADRRARVLRFPTNRGRSAARNAGARVTAGDVIVFLDVDVEPGPDAAGRLADAVGTGVASVARVRPVPDRPAEPYQDYAAHHPRGPSGGLRAGHPVDWRFFLAGACAVRRDAFEREGGFREDVAYGEDVALACALRTTSPRGLRLADAVVRLHDVGDLPRALRHSASFGEALRAFGADCPDLTRRFRRAAPLGVLPSAPLRWAVDALPPGAARRRAVRSLLALAALRAYRRA